MELVRDFQAITSSGAILSYALYTIQHPQPLLGITLLFVLYGIFRYIYLVSSQGEGGAPDETLLKDKPIIINALLYTLVTIVILLWGPAPS